MLGSLAFPVDTLTENPMVETSLGSILLLMQLPALQCSTCAGTRSTRETVLLVFDEVWSFFEQRGRGSVLVLRRLSWYMQGTAGE